MKHSEELRARIVAEYKAGASTWQLAKSYQVARSTIERWVAAGARLQPRVRTQKKQDVSSGVAASEPLPMPAEGIDLDELAWRIVSATVEAVAAIAGVTRDADWLRGQNARDLAILYGVFADKLYRLISAIRPAEDLEAADGEGAAEVPAGDPPEASAG